MSRVALVERLKVFYEGDAAAGRLHVGDLAVRHRQIYFEYTADFLRRKLELSPLHLPLAPGVRAGDPRRFDGLFGLFDDSLPDGWGRLLLDRYVARYGFSPAELTPLDRLAWVGPSAIGALSYEPSHERPLGAEEVDLHHLATEARRVLEDRASDALPALLRAGGSPQGARPKALILLGPDGETIVSGERHREGFTPYLVKYAAKMDAPTSGAVELAYAAMARAAGIDVPPARLLGARGRHPGFFAVRRFDVRDGVRVHVHTAAGLLHAPPGLTFVDYEQLLKLAWGLTRDQRCVSELFRRVVFNVGSHNRDDHARNFAFEMSPQGVWTLAPAYDLTFSEGPGGEHCTTVLGEGRAPGRGHLERLAAKASLDPRQAVHVIEEVSDAVGRWPTFARAAGLSAKAIRDIGRRHGLRSSDR